MSQEKRKQVKDNGFNLTKLPYVKHYLIDKEPQNKTKIDT